MSSDSTKWRFAVDRGGTFTDIVAVDPEGIFHIHKLLSHSSAYKDASIEGIKRVLALSPKTELSGEHIDRIRFGTTVATNALLERKGCRVALLVTKGMADLLEIGHQDRPDIFSLCINKPSNVYTSVVEADERIDQRGNIIKQIDQKGMGRIVRSLKNEDVDAVAIVFMHSWKNPVHELLCEAVLKKYGITNIFLSHRSVNRIKIVGRGRSALADAYLSRVLSEYMQEIRTAAGDISVEFMQSNGATCRPAEFTGKSALLSGPAGGVIAVAGVAAAKGLKGVIGFDMGGTSTDVSRYDGKIDKVYEQTIGGVSLQTEVLNIVTVAAGGGSILGFDGQKMTVGPESAGSCPGPACYGFGGPLTVTDANLLTGRLIPEHFPLTFGSDGCSSLDMEIVKEKFEVLASEINRAMDTQYAIHDIALGFLRVANEKMAMAIKEISVSKGFDVRDYALVSFGGAGGQHACSIALLLDMEMAVAHPLSSVMSAYGIGLSKQEYKLERTVLMAFHENSVHELDELFRDMEKELFKSSSLSTKAYEKRYEVDIRPSGTESYLTIEYYNYEKTAAEFEQQYERAFGFSPSAASLEAVNVRVELKDSHEFFPPYKEGNESSDKAPGSKEQREIYYEGNLIKAPVYRSQAIFPADDIKGPAFIADGNTTIVVEPGFDVSIDEQGIITLLRTDKKEARLIDNSGRPDPVMLEVFNNLFKGTAIEMGLALKNTAYSVSMKERLDFSCALFDPQGNLVANAPHIPVHLGSMADTVRAVIEDRGDVMKQGDIYLTNNPYRGGSHLPDMTVVCPVFSDDGKLIFFTAARGHHADVGGTVPGSMPPVASHIDEEGVLIDSFLLVSEGKFREDELKDILLGHKYPARNIPERLADLRAQIAACTKGVNEIKDIISKYGLETVNAYMKYIQDNAEYSVKKALAQFLDGNIFHSSFEDRMDDGSLIKVSISVDGGINPPETLKAVIDFSGTCEQHLHDNLNAPVSVTSSAVMYVLRALVAKDIPLNSGSLKPVDIIIPVKTILSPEYPAPVATGNVETSQRIVDVLLGAFGITAASQGTMNNLLFEIDGETPYYETIAGGSGAMDGCHGASGVQVHMTNTRMTDPEVLEFRHPGVSG